MHKNRDEHRSDATTLENRKQSVLNRRRLTSVVELARIYADLGVKELADAVGRDKTRIIPPTGNPKLDMIGSLAGVLEWTVGDVVDALEGGPKAKSRIVNTRKIVPRGRFSKLHRIARKLDRLGRSKWARVVSGMLLLQAADGGERAKALGMLGLSQMRDGDPCEALASLRRGLNQQGIEFATKLELKTHLCRTLLLLDHVIEARSVASDILKTIEEHAVEDEDLFSFAERSARYVRGNAIRASIDRGVGTVDLLGARKDLLKSLQITKNEYLHDLDETVVTLGALLEIDSALGKVTSVKAIQRIEEALETARIQNEAGDLSVRSRRAWAWWGIFGAEIVLREKMTESSWMKAHEFAQKAIEFSSDPGEDILRARGYVLSFEAWKQWRCAGHLDTPWHLEPIELQLFVRTMGAQIGFMESGWRILNETGTLMRAKNIDPRTWRKGFHRH